MSGRTLLIPCAHLSCGHISSSLDHSKTTSHEEETGLSLSLMQSSQAQDKKRGLRSSPGSEQVDGSGLASKAATEK